MAFLPEGYKAPSSGGYMRLQSGDNRFRVMSEAIVGTEIWTEDSAGRRPHRFRESEDIPHMDDQIDRPKHFWAMVVWNYASSELQIFEITQRTIQSAINGLVESDDWGDPAGYDLVIKKTGVGRDTEYQVMPGRPCAPPTDAQRAYVESSINLDAIYTGGDPFEDSAPPAQSPTQQTPLQRDQCKIDDVKEKQSATGAVYIVTTSRGEFGTRDGKVAAQAKQAIGSTALVGWRANDKGGRVAHTIEAVNAKANPAQQATEHMPVEDDDIPF